MAAKSNNKNSQVGVVLVTHGSFGQTLLEAAETVLGHRKTVWLSVSMSRGC